MNWDSTCAHQNFHKFTTKINEREPWDAVFYWPWARELVILIKLVLLRPPSTHRCQPRWVHNSPWVARWPQLAHNPLADVCGGKRCDTIGNGVDSGAATITWAWEGDWFQSHNKKDWWQTEKNGYWTDFGVVHAGVAGKEGVWVFCDVPPSDNITILDENDHKGLVFVASAAKPIPSPVPFWKPLSQTSAIGKHL